MPLIYVFSTVLECIKMNSKAELCLTLLGHNSPADSIVGWRGIIYPQSSPLNAFGVLVAVFLFFSNVGIYVICIMLY